jgi:hypothetical protein
MCHALHGEKAAKSQKDAAEMRQIIRNFYKTNGMNCHSPGPTRTPSTSQAALAWHKGRLLNPYVLT